jgi:hypothetical protein
MGGVSLPVPTACGGGLRARCLRLPGLTRCLMVLRATDTYVCNGGACISTGECCKDGANGDEPGCPVNTKCNGETSPTGAACDCDSDTACCDKGVDCPLPVYPNGFVCTVVATPGGDDGVCGCAAGKISAGGALLSLLPNDGRGRCTCAHCVWGRAACSLLAAAWPDALPCGVLRATDTYVCNGGFRV